MPRNPLYRAHRLKLDYDLDRHTYVLKKDDRFFGSTYRTNKQVRSLLVNLRGSIEEDRRFRGIDLVVTERAKERLALAEVSESDVQRLGENSSAIRT